MAGDAQRRQGSGSGLRVFAAVSLAYLFLTSLFTYPLVFKLHSHLCGDIGDNYGFLWQFRWFSLALTELHTSPFYAPDLNHPVGTSLLLNPTTLFNTVSAIFLQRIFSVVTTYNLLVLASFWISAVAMYLLSFYLTRSPVSSFVAGAVYAFSSYHFGHALGHLSTLSIEWIPLFLLYVLKSLHTHKGKHLALASLFYILCALCSWHFLLCCGLLLGWTVLYFSLPWKGKRSFQAICRGGAILCITLAILAPLLVPMMLEASRTTSISGHAPRQYPADIVGFLVPGFTSTFGMLFSPIWSRFKANPIESSTYIGYGVIFLALWAAVRMPRQRIAYWLYTLVIFLTLSLGPFLNLLGREFPIPLPYAILHYVVPFASIAGVPARFHVVTTVCLAVLCGFGVQSLLQDLRPSPSTRAQRRLLRWVAAGLLLLLLFFEHLHVPMFMTKHSVSPFYESLGQDTAEYAVVDFTARGKALFCQSVHRKRLVGGYVARGAEGRQTFLKESEIVRHILATASASSAHGPAFPGAQAQRILRKYNIRYLIFPKPPDPSGLRDILVSFVSDSTFDGARIMNRLKPEADQEKALSREILRTAKAVLESKGVIGMLAFALKTRFFFASHTELLPSNTIGPFVPDSERIVADIWSLPVTYEDDEIRVYSVDPQIGRPSP